MVHFEELVCDFIKDESGIWWLINIKAFKLKEGTDLEKINIRPICYYKEDADDFRIE